MQLGPRPPITRHANEPRTAVELVTTITHGTTTPRTLRSFHEHVQPLAGHGHLSEQDALTDTVEHFPRPRLQFTTVESVVQVVTRKTTAQHHPETITRS